MAKENSYLETINRALRPSQSMPYSALDLFAGCGGLSLGFEAAGIKTTGIEMKKDCCDTYNRNLSGECINDTLTPDYNFPKADIVIGGPPCQPFSHIGKQMGIKDSRDGFPIFISAVRKLKPKIWVFENVQGLLVSHKWYLNQIIRELKKEGYVVDIRAVSMVEYGVPQNRQRLIAVGHDGSFEFPSPSPKKRTAGDAIGETAFVAPPDSKFLTQSMEQYIARYEKASKCIRPRDIDLSKPVRTLTCRNLCAATSDMIRLKLPDGRRRMLHVREAARLQSFPDWFEFEGTQTDAFNQIGNAVPPYFAMQLGAKIREYLEVQSHFVSARVPKKKRGQTRLSEEYA